MEFQDKGVVVTGAAGYVGAHVVARLLTEGYRVRAVIRSLDRAAEVLAALRVAEVDPTDRLEFAAADLGADAGWLEAASGARYVLHVASPFPSSTPTSDDDLIIPARDGALRVLRAARDAGVERVVLTSSFAAVGYSPKADASYNETDWTNPDDQNTAYIRSKTIAEIAAWDFIRTEGGKLELTVINPVGVFGPTLLNKVTTSIGLIKAMLDGDMPAAIPQRFGVVDVRDVADIHVRAMTNPAAPGERFIATADGPSVSFLDVAGILRHGLGSAADRAPVTAMTDDDVRKLAETVPEMRESLTQLGQNPVIYNDKAKTVLGWTPRPVDETILASARSLSQLGLLAD